MRVNSAIKGHSMAGNGKNTLSDKYVQKPKQLLKLMFQIGVAGISNSMTISLFSPALKQLKIRNTGGFLPIVSFIGRFLHGYIYLISKSFENFVFKNV